MPDDVTRSRAAEEVIERFLRGTGSWQPMVNGPIHPRWLREFAEAIMADTYATPDRAANLRAARERAINEARIEEAATVVTIPLTDWHDLLIALADFLGDDDD